MTGENLGFRFGRQKKENSSIFTEISQGYGWMLKEHLPMDQRFRPNLSKCALDRGFSSRPT